MCCMFSLFVRRLKRPNIRNSSGESLRKSPSESAEERATAVRIFKSANFNRVTFKRSAAPSPETVVTGDSESGF